MGRLSIFQSGGDQTGGVASTVKDAENEDGLCVKAIADEITLACPEAEIDVVSKISTAVAASWPTCDKEEGMFQVVGEAEGGGFACFGQVCGGVFEVADGVLGEPEARGHYLFPRALLRAAARILRMATEPSTIRPAAASSSPFSILARA